MAAYRIEFISAKLRDGEDVDPVNLFNPRTSPYVRFHPTEAAA